MDSTDRRRLSEMEIENVAKSVAKETVKELLNNAEFIHATCKFNGISSVQHAQDHKDMREVIDFIMKVNRIKWEIPKTIVVVLVSAGVIWALKVYKVFQ